MEKILKEIAVNEGFSKKANVEIFSSGLKDGSNFHGGLKKGRITEGDRSLSVVIKKEVQCREINSKEKFSNETNFYSRIYPELRPYGNMPRVPRFFGSSVDTDGATIVMEDLAVEGYQMAPVGRFLRPDEVELVMKALGELHEASRKMKAQNPPLFDDLAGKLKESFCVGRLQEEILAQCFKYALRATAEYLPSKYRERLESFNFANAKHWALKGNRPDAVFTHGDSWSSNFMIKYEGDTAMSVALVDWQMCRVASPLLDISELIFTSTSGTGCPSAPECTFGLTMAMTILPFALGQADPSLIMTPEKLLFSDDPIVMKRIAGIVKAAVDEEII